MRDHTDLYLETLGLSASSRRGARKSALSRAHDLRKFEIELYWKRANYFWLLQGAVFAAIGISLNSSLTKTVPIFPIILCALGVVTATAGYLAALGSKFWQLNWEHHVDMLETEFEGNLYKTVFVAQDSARWSVSKVNERLAACFMIFWIMIFAILSFRINSNWTLLPKDLAFPPNRTEVETVLAWLFVTSVWRLAFWSGKPQGEEVRYSDADAAALEDRSQDHVIKSYLVRRGQIR